MVEVKSDKIQEESEKTLGLFDDNSFREEEIFVTSYAPSQTTTNLFIFPLILTLLLNFCQLSET